MSLKLSWLWSSRQPKSAGEPGAVRRLAAVTPLAAAALAAFLAASPARTDPADLGTPQTRLGALFEAVEMNQLFGDSKTFADAIPLSDPKQLTQQFLDGRPWTNAALKQFVLSHFSVPFASAPSRDRPSVDQDIRRHILGLWSVLTRPPVAAPTNGSLLSLPHPYVVPGGRFRELYYWDSYFTMLGLKLDGRQPLVEAMIDDFGSLIDRYGHIPNGTRSYYLSRSQPPFFYAMVALSSEVSPSDLHRRLRWMLKEHAYWMSGEDALKPGEARSHLIRLADGDLLNRYHDALSTPRDESYREDVTLAARSGREPGPLYSDLRSGSESGWDFSSRWLADGRSLDTIHVNTIAPVDLNSLLFGMERTILSTCKKLGDTACASQYQRRADARARAVNNRLWDSRKGVYRDFDTQTGRRTDSLSAAGLYPLFVGLAEPDQARKVAAATRRYLLARGGLRTTTQRTGQQWDLPNGWAPLQWIAVQGLLRYHQAHLANDISERWLATVNREYAASGRLLEKYDVEEVKPGGGGEYPLQDGFGWTNGVTRALLSDHPPPPP